MADWFPEAIVDKGNDSGEYTDTGEPKGLLHTTEGKSYAGARGAYVANNSWPHATCTFETGVFKIWQHVPLSKPSRALRNESGGVQTNRDNVVQLEIVGTADRTKAGSWGDQYVENFPNAYLNGIARWMRFVEQNHGVPRRCTVTFKTYPESYGANGIRLSGSAWDAYSGWLGHQHAPENCVAPDTPILCADLTWRPAGDLSVGTRIIAFDEDGDGVQWHNPGSGRRFRTATITRNDPANKPCALVRTDKAEVVASLDHPWLVRRPVGSRGRGRFTWVPTCALLEDDKLAWFADPWTTEETWEAGWIAGMFDADGWLSTARMSNGAYLGIGQRSGATQDRVIDAFRRRGFEPTIVQRDTHKGWDRQPFAQISIWGMRDQLRCLGTIRPPRLLENELSVLWEGRQVRNNTSVNTVPVREVVEIGECEIASITTSTGTFITAGFLTHNSHGDPGLIDIDYLLAGEGEFFVTEDDKIIMRNILRQEVPALVKAAVDDRFSAGGTPTRQQIAGNDDIVGLVELGLQRSAQFTELEAKVEAIRVAVEEPIPPPPS